MVPGVTEGTDFRVAFGSLMGTVTGVFTTNWFRVKVITKISI